MTSGLLILIIAFSLFVNVFQLPLPFDQYAYMMAREKIKQDLRAIQAHNNFTSKEKTVELYFEFLRLGEFIETKDYFYSSRPIETEVENITRRSFYKFLTLLPKGGNLHLHEFQILDRKLLLQSIENSSDYDLLYICDQSNCETNKYYLSFFKINVPVGWTKVKGSNWTIDDIVRKTTLTGILNDLPIRPYATDAAARWNLAEKQGVFSFYGELTRHNATRFNYMKLVLDEALKENVQLLEFRRGLFGRTFYFNDNGTKILLNTTNELNMLLEFKNDYITKNPKLIDFIFVIYSTRSSSKVQIKSELSNVLSLQRLYPDFVRGYDMVGEEDRGHTLLFHSDNLINAFNHSQFSNGTFNLLFHSGETNWPQEYFPANHGDDVSTFENIYDALILRTRRIGHGLSLIKRPDLFEYIRKREIAIEICPTSNQILGYVADLRNHPGIVYHRSGIPIVLAGDDPGSFGYNQLTIDFYLVTMAWGLYLTDLKQFAWNSIKYSSIPESRKTIGFQKWQTQWDFFIDSAYTLACNLTLPNTRINISDILPSYGPYDQSVNVTLFGSGFEKAICHKIICQFGQNQTNGFLSEINEMICPTPSGQRFLSTVPVSIIVGDQIIQSGFNYTFLSSVSIIDDETFPTATSSKGDRFASANKNFFIVVFILLFALIG